MDIRRLLGDLTRAPALAQPDPQGTFGSLSPYTPPRTERTYNAVKDVTGDPVLANAASFLDMGGATLDLGQQSAEAAQAGNYGTAAGLGALGLAGVLPIPAAKVAKGAKKIADKTGLTKEVLSLAPEVLAANRTARASGAVGSKAITPRYISETVTPNETVLNFGAGKPGKGGVYGHSETIRQAQPSATVREYDFGQNAVGAIEPSDTVFASNVLNVQSGPDMMRDTLNQIKGAAGRRAVFNLPQSPNKHGMKPEEVESLVTEVFGIAPTRVGGTKSAPLWEVRMPSGEVAETPLAMGGNAQAMAALPERSAPLPAGASGSYDPTANVPFLWQGKNPSELSPEDLAELGNAFGVERLGPLSPNQTFQYADEAGEFAIPGGLEGKFTYADMRQMKANPVNPERIDPMLHSQIQQKITRSLMPDDGNVSDAQVWNGMVFGATSPNNPLTPNQLAMSRLRVNSMEDLDRIADMTPWGIDDMSKISKEQRKQVNDEIAAKLGLNAGSAGGLGVRGTADYSRVSDMAKMFRKNPQFFRRKGDETWPQFVERVVTQTPGLSAKTGSFGVVWQDPAEAAISAIDRHMVNAFERQGGKIFTPEKRKAFEDRVLNLYNKKRVAAGKEPYTDISQMNDGDLGYELLQEMGKAKKGKFRGKDGKLNKNMPGYLKDEEWIVEPQEYMTLGDNYKKALEVNAQQAREHGLGLFESQWHIWDRQRRRLEPHENMFPGLEKLPRPSVDQLREADAAHRATGHKNYSKQFIDPEDKSKGFRLRPTKPLKDAARLTYFGLGGLPLALPALRDSQE